MRALILALLLAGCSRAVIYCDLEDGSRVQSTFAGPSGINTRHGFVPWQRVLVCDGVKVGWTEENPPEKWLGRR
jgi:hypothetical protein